MKVLQCHYCGKMFRSMFDGTVCPKCKPIDDLLFERIENYLKKYPNSNALEISDGLEIPVFEVTRFIDSGRLVVNRGRFDRM